MRICVWLSSFVSSLSLACVFLLGICFSITACESTNNIAKTERDCTKDILNMHTPHRGHVSIQLDQNKIFISDYLQLYLLPNRFQKSEIQYLNPEEIYITDKHRFYTWDRIFPKHTEVENLIRKKLSIKRIDINASAFTNLNNIFGRSNFSFSSLGNGLYFISGGLQDYSKILSTSELRSLSNSKVIQVFKLTQPRLAPTSTTLKDGRILIVGGKTSEPYHLKVSRANIFDPIKRVMLTTGPININRSCHTATLLKDGNVLIVGGINNDEKYIQLAELYNPKTNLFKVIGTSWFPHCGHTATLLKNGKVLIAGGFVKIADSNNPNATAYSSMDTVEIFDPVTNSFVKYRPMCERRSEHSAILAANELVLITGGSKDKNSDDSSFNALKSAEIINTNR